MGPPYDIERAEAISAFIDEAIEDFTLDRLRSYYLVHPSLALSAFAMYDKVMASLTSSRSAVLVLCSTSVELGLKATLLRLLVSGLVHNESVADLVSDLVAKQNGVDRFMPFLARVVSEYGGDGVDVLKIEGHAKAIWEEIKIFQEKRNRVVHQGVPAAVENVTSALRVGDCVLGMFLPYVLKRFGLALDKKLVIANA